MLHSMVSPDGLPLKEQNQLFWELGDSKIIGPEASSSTGLAPWFPLPGGVLGGKVVG
jgi:hypothetical protein